MSYWKDKVALITGGSGGLGLALARKFGLRGARVVIASRGAENLNLAAESLRSEGADVLAVTADVTRQEDVETLVRRCNERFGRIDVLVNNAGRSARGEILATSPNDFHDLMELNLIAAVRCTQAAAEHLLATQGHVVNIGSLASKCAARYLGAYPASKFALAAYSQQLRLELSPRGLHVLLVCPGPITRRKSGNTAPRSTCRKARASRAGESRWEGSIPTTYPGGFSAPASTAARISCADTR